ncbi:protein MAIN-LIKE 1-like [Coffea arabica]|uniref:Protein MAIN-LIKE 1-like n=1 Tax=Coffea arabica TaxID=13443 RepID=A0ABM4UR64_COFAR
MIRNFTVGDDVVEVLTGSGFENLLKFTGFFGIHCHYLVQAFATKYNSNTQSFILGQENAVKLYFGLRDILQITGLPISGIPLVCQEARGEEIANEIFPNLVVHFEMKGFHLKTLRDIATLKASDKEFAHPLDIRVRATVLYLLGCLIFPDSSCTHVRAIYGYFVKDINKISEYAWGEACLVEIHHSLSKFSSRNVSNEKYLIGSSMFALMVGHVQAPFRLRFLLSILLMVSGKLF